MQATINDRAKMSASPSTGTGGTNDYTALINKPSINNVELTGNKTSSDLGLANANDIITSYNDLNDKPHINGVELTGNKTSSDLGLPSVVEYSTSEFDTGLKWLNGKKIYGLIVPSWNSVGGNEYRYDLWRHSPTALIGYGGSIVSGSITYFLPYNDGTNFIALRYNSNMGVLQLYSNVGAPSNSLYVYFTK